MKIIVHYPFEAAEIDELRTLIATYGDHEVTHVETEDEAVAEAADAEVILGHFQPAVCAAAPKLKWVQSFSAGMDKFLFPAIIANEVEVSNAAGLHAPQGAEHAWAMVLALSHQLFDSLDNQRQRQWGGGPSPVELTGMTLGLIGLGGFGIEMLKRASGYDMTVIAVDAQRRDKPDGVDELKPSTKETLRELLQRSDIVMVACPRTEETYHLIGREELATMKKTAYLINVTRGGIIDDPALAAALASGEIAAAGLDVTEVEPLAADSPLWEAPNLIMTPHRAGASQKRPRKIFERFRDNLERYLKGERPHYIIDKAKGY